MYRVGSIPEGGTAVNRVGSIPEGGTAVYRVGVEHISQASRTATHKCAEVTS